ncbi:MULTISPECIES: SDR family NAD(P)-dependent oxidoreductase [Streptomyces]|uniref:SDR family NAD(P)-dependent oxidoreductase n=1 Tax=Streptomyces TaxID=1883 RepID=UPI002E38040D|nr:SDR family oxidoreductase [Streptomyces canus]WSZ34877.1 SDR family oxidoreductase [Streptomyces sp. NBC_00882]
MGTTTRRLEGKAGVITGATSGLGLAVLRAMTREGAAMVAVGRNADRGREIEKEIRDAGGTVVFHAGDVTNESDIEGAITTCREAFGRFDIMHNNAGYLVMREPHEISNEEWQASVAMNLTAVLWGCKHAVLAMKAEGHGGAIINTASTASFTATPDTVAYVATKTGVLGITRSTALAYADLGIRCNALCPGDFESPMLQDFFDGSPDPVVARREMENLYPTKRILKPEDVAGAAVFLASDEAHGVNGTTLVVDDAILAKTY